MIVRLHGRRGLGNVGVEDFWVIARRHEPEGLLRLDRDRLLGLRNRVGLRFDRDGRKLWLNRRRDRRLLGL